MSASSLAFHWPSITSASVLMTPVAPTTSAQAMVMAPSRLCQSNQAIRRDLSLSVPKLRRRVNGQYSTTPEMIATRNKNPIAPRNSLPGWPANMSTWSFRNISIGPPPTEPSGLAVWASYALQRRRVRIAVGLVVGEGDHRVRFVLVPQDILQDATGIVRQRRAGDLVDAPLHGARLGDLGLRIVAEQLVDLVMEDQRQAGDAQQQQEQRRYQAAPGVNHRPDANGSGFQRGLLSLDVRRATICTTGSPSPGAGRRRSRRFRRAVRDIDRIGDVDDVQRRAPVLPFVVDRRVAKHDGGNRQRVRDVGKGCADIAHAAAKAEAASAAPPGRCSQPRADASLLRRVGRRLADQRRI